MGKSNLGILTDEVIVITQPVSAGKKSGNTDHDTYSRKNNVLFTQDYTVFIISSLEIQTMFVRSSINAN